MLDDSRIDNPDARDTAPINKLGVLRVGARAAVAARASIRDIYSREWHVANAAAVQALRDLNSELARLRRRP
jgi:hypothetical protein